MRSFTGLVGTPLSGPGNVVPGLVPTAAIKAKRCYFPRSSWVHAFILTCDDKLAVWFKRRRRGRVPGVCCLYPQSNQQLYNLAVAWWSAGHFVHKFLYRIRAYVPVAPPKAPCGTDCPPGVVVGCCANALPATLFATLTNRTGTCGCLPDSVVLTWNGTAWQNLAVSGCGTTIDFTFRCTVPSNLWFLQSNALQYSATAAAGGSCSPFVQRFPGFQCTNPALCTGAADVTVTT
jgi:hypothetical protein